MLSWSIKFWFYFNFWFLFDFWFLWFFLYFVNFAALFSFVCWRGWSGGCGWLGFFMWSFFDWFIWYFPSLFSAFWFFRFHFIALLLNVNGIILIFVWFLFFSNFSFVSYGGKLRHFSINYFDSVFVYFFFRFTQTACIKMTRKDIKDIIFLQSDERKWFDSSLIITESKLTIRIDTPNPYLSIISQSITIFFV